MKYIELQQSNEASSQGTKMERTILFGAAFVPECNGQRLNKEALHFFINAKNIAELAAMDISALYQWMLTAEEECRHSRQ